MRYDYAELPLPDDTPPVVRHEVNRTVSDLVREYRNQVPPATIRAYAVDALREMTDVKVPQFIPALLIRAVRKRVRDAALITAV